MPDKAKFINPSDRVGKVLFSYIEDIIDYNLNREYGYELLTKSVLYQFWFLLIKDMPHKEFARRNVVSVDKISADEERQTLLLVITVQILNKEDRLRFDIDSENLLVKTLVQTLQHGVIICIGT